MKKIAFVTAGGFGDRMHKDTPKQFLELQGIPVIIRTLLRFKLKSMAESYGISKLEAVVEGGINSQESISNGIEYLLSKGYGFDDIVLVHESVRPFISEKIISDNIDTCINKGNAVTVIRGNESYLYSEDGISSEKHFLRESMFMVQTPQTFRLGQIRKAINEAQKKGIVSQSLYILMSQLKYTPLYMVDGDRFNIKLTYPEDLRIFEMLMSIR